MTAPNPKLEARIAHGVSEIGAEAWDQLSQGRPFQSYRWYAFGERAMSDCRPCYIVLSHAGEPIARATFWLIRNEPLPVQGPARIMLQAIVKRWPLFVCRSPLSNSSGLILPEASLREEALAALSDLALQQARSLRASFVIFDYLERGAVQREKWPAGFAAQTVNDPGSMLRLVWPDFESYLASLSPKTRKNYRRYCRDAESRRLRISFHPQPVRLQEAGILIRNIERRYREVSNPWQMSSLENFPMVGGRMITAEIDGGLVGCELLLGDGDELLVTALGLDHSVPNTYFSLNYADIRAALEAGARVLHWGSGIFDVKRRLGFQPEYNDSTVSCGTGFISGLIVRMASRWSQEGKRQVPD